MLNRKSKVLVVVPLYWIVSISIVFVNKHLLNNNNKQDLSIFIAWFQCLVSVLTLFLLKLVMPGKVPPLEIPTLLHSDMLSLSFNFVASLTLNNLMLKHISVAFYQIGRSFTLIFTIILSVCMLHKHLKITTLIPCVCIILGFFISVGEEEESGTVSIWGIIYGILSSLSAAYCAIYFRKVEGITNGSAVKIAYYNNVNSFIIFLPLVISTNQLSNVFHSTLIYDKYFWMCLGLSGVMSLTMGWVSALQIQYTSPVTHHISINAKSVAQTVIAIILYKESKSLVWWTGNLLVMSGILSYAWLNFQEREEPILLKSSPKPEKNGVSVL
ncbi:hypothetical protein LOTGIDRAFT_221416 [Lottia gigantea]|uniref:Sugar phosphate transporter domain-containing protein n=1 Tax=Lottia gigantea TaxID=225164 RepID=V3Z3H8_LOTGI|nr:hypothetical protein LOTGIDRAFT_221416 [Lottia gigantea]ESO85183.1 hypothetical protein LOTGIDRAFT_221416 [Lottia gigantea]